MKKKKIKNKKIHLPLFAAMQIFIFLIFSNTANANTISIIRDDEVESTLSELSAPIFKAAGLERQHIKLYLVNSDEINAYVIDGQKIFIYAGMIKDVPDANSLIGIIAHESGHIAAGHIIKTENETKLANSKILISNIIGIITGIASGSGEAAIGTMSNLSNHTILGFLKYSRIQEHAADKMAIKYLQKANISPKGFVEYFKIMKRKERILITPSDSYYLTHPLSKERIKYLNRELELKDKKSYSFPNKQLEKKFLLAKAKVAALITPSNQTLKKYNNNNSEEALYSKSIAYYMKHNYKSAIKLIDQLINIDNTNPYYHEAKAQFLFESGDLNNSIVEYKKALSLRPNSQLIKIELATTIISSRKKELQKKAILLLVQAKEKEPELPIIFQELGKAYYILGDYINSDINFAKFYIKIDDKKTAHSFLIKAKNRIQNHKNSNIKDEIIALEKEISH